MEGVVLQLVAVQAAAAGRAAACSRGARRPDGAGETYGGRGGAPAAARRHAQTHPRSATWPMAVGLSEKRLNSGFRQMFGATAFETLRNPAAGNMRGQALEEGAVSLKEVSFRVGYTHVSNFVHAFRARYKTPPRVNMSGASGGVIRRGGP